mmetsp:Transcript_111362/g.314392  ORF Transcript_111362/g.314392 Transcript_111362/m.314392 type:complete len:212 (+) Transcript_111362:682-1317(+)
MELVPKPRALLNRQASLSAAACICEEVVAIAVEQRADCPTAGVHLVIQEALAVLLPVRRLAANEDARVLRVRRVQVLRLEPPQDERCWRGTLCLLRSHGQRLRLRHKRHMVRRLRRRRQRLVHLRHGEQGLHKRVHHLRHRLRQGCHLLHGCGQLRHNRVQTLRRSKRQGLQVLGCRDRVQRLHGHGAVSRRGQGLKTLRQPLYSEGRGRR